MTKCCPNPIRFSSVQRRKVEIEFSFSGGAINGNGGISMPDVGILAAASNRKTDPSRTTHAISGLGNHGVRWVREDVFAVLSEN